MPVVWKRFAGEGSVALEGMFSGAENAFCWAGKWTGLLVMGEDGSPFEFLLARWETRCG
jgi:hypothetical protein